MKKIIILLALCLVACSAKPEANVQRTSILPPEHEITLSEQVKRLCLDLAERAFRPVFPDCTIAFNDDLLTVIAWQEPLGEVCVKLAAGEMQEQREDWITLRDTVQEQCRQIMTFAEDEGEPIYMNFYLADDRDHLRRLITIIDGEVLTDESGL